MANVIVPLVLIRHVAELPEPAMLADALDRFRNDLEQHRQSGRAQRLYVINRTNEGRVLGAIVYPEAKAVEIIETGRSAPPHSSRTTFTPNSLHLFHGFLVFTTEFLAPESLPEISNRDVAAVCSALREQAQARPDGKGQRIRLFHIAVSDRFGRPVAITAGWDPAQGILSWEWTGLESDLQGGLYLTVEDARLLAGFITLLRMSDPDAWSWNDEHE
ncbi:MAG TPA: hypothetical protein EYP77_04680 [Anaerolineae bacterium]|nr:hypothetical protein [Anaerolineae bacterium]